MEFDFIELAKLIKPIQLVLIIVIFWLIKLISKCHKELFSHHATLEKLTGLLERLIYDKRNNG